MHDFWHFLFKIKVLSLSELLLRLNCSNYFIRITQTDQVWIYDLLRRITQAFRVFGCFVRVILNIQYLWHCRRQFAVMKNFFKNDCCYSIEKTLKNPQNSAYQCIVSWRTMSKGQAMDVQIKHWASKIFNSKTTQKLKSKANGSKIDFRKTTHQLYNSTELRGGPTLGPVKYAKEVSHVKHITWSWIVRKLNFDPVRTNEGGSKVSFRTIHGHVINKLFENLILIHLH